jgi:hypothetical protein
MAVTQIGLILNKMGTGAAPVLFREAELYLK